MTPQGPVRYTTNLIRALRVQEEKHAQWERLTRIGLLGGLTFFGLAFVYSVLNVLFMEKALRIERVNLDRVRQEEAKYRSSPNTVDKADVEQLDKLQSSGIFWTRKLSALGQHLPEGYTLKSISFEPPDLKVSGIGTTDSRQGHLVEISDYLQALSRDSGFTKTFSKPLLISSVRRESEGGPQVTFEFMASSKEAKKARR